MVTPFTDGLERVRPGIRLAHGATVKQSCLIGCHRMRHGVRVGPDHGVSGENGELGGIVVHVSNLHGVARGEIITGTG
jgi:hypothetical protein